MKKKISYGDKYAPVATIETQDEADRYFEECVQHSMSFGKTREEAEKLERLNIGYWSGYLDRATQERVFGLFKTEHPIFGKEQPTPKEAFTAGAMLAAQRNGGMRQEDLERLGALGCQQCGGTLEHGHEFFFHSRCHPASPTVLAFYRDGLVVIQCGVCKRLIVEIAVASK